MAVDWDERIIFDRRHSCLGYRTCNCRTFAVGSASREMVDACITSPSVRRLAGNLGVDLEALAARLGRTHLTLDDVQGPGQAPARPTAPGGDCGASGPVHDEPLSRFAKLTAANLTAAALIPTVAHHDSCDATRVGALRSTLRAKGRKLTALAFHVAVLARCLPEFPRFNASLSRDGERLSVKDYIHIDIAVDMPHGLIVQVIRNADRMRLGQMFERVLTTCSREDTLTTSLQDWRKCRRAEVQDVTAWVVDILRADGRPAPVNAQVVRIAFDIKAGRLAAQPDNAQRMAQALRGPSALAP